MLVLDWNIKMNDKLQPIEIQFSPSGINESPEKLLDFDGYIYTSIYNP